MIGILDFGLGNLASLANMFRKLQIPVEIVKTAEQITAADRLVLPGVGAFDHGMRLLESSGIREVLEYEVINKKKPILGICLGMQLLSKCSEEGELKGLGWIEAETKRLRFRENNQNLRIPHMGWNYVQYSESCPLFVDQLEKMRFYFVHSYHVVCDRIEDVVAITDYGDNLVAAVQNENVFGVQFHPEKSHRFGMQVLDRFANATQEEIVRPKELSSSVMKIKMLSEYSDLAECNSSSFQIAQKGL